MTRLKGPGGTSAWVWTVVTLLVLAALLVLLDSLDILQLGFS